VAATPTVDGQTTRTKHRPVGRRPTSKGDAPSPRGLQVGGESRYMAEGTLAARDPQPHAVFL